MNSKYYKPILFLHYLSLLKRKLVLPFVLIKSRIWKAPSYYPEKERKTQFRIFVDLLFHIFRYGSIEWNHKRIVTYLSMGFNRFDEYRAATCTHSRFVKKQNLPNLD